MVDLQDLDLMNDGCLAFAGPGDTLAAGTLRSGTLLAGQLPIPESTGACFDSHKAPIVTKRRSQLLERPGPRGKRAFTGM